MFNKTFSKLIAVFALAAIVLPSAGLVNASNDDRGGMESRFGSTNEFGVRILGDDNRDNDNNEGKHKGNHHKQDNKIRKEVREELREFRKDEHKGLNKMFFSGEVTSTSVVGFTIETKNDTTLTIDASSAKLVSVGGTVISLSDIKIGDKVYVTGIKMDNTVEALVVYSVSGNLKPAIAKGTVTDVTDTQLTLQTEDNKTVTVNTDGSTKVVDEDGNPATTADIEVGTEVKTFGLWDTVVHVFNAIKIKLF